MGIIKKIINSKDYTNEIARKSNLLEVMDDDTLKKMQSVLLEMYEDVVDVCDKYDISLFVIGGTALGAVRHHGFIPWDDDMDLSMTRSDYKRFVEVFEKELGDKYILNAPNYSKKACHKYPRILKKDTYYRSLIDSQEEVLHCIFIDLFILENMPNNPVYRKIKGIYCNFLYMMCWEVFIWENRNDQVREFLSAGGALNYYIRILVGFMFSYKKSEKWFDTFDKAIQYDDDKSDYCCLATGRKRYFGEIMRREQWFPGIKQIFEGKEVLIFQDYDYYLKNLYGNYMQIPPKEKQERHNVCEVRFTR